ncbi:hypothetical protein [Kutzneria kofuensis]|uniref:hypothetical protein n=1 Tax=Kutzneria kofuensis TaxID=103725 RepID=UPI0031E9E9F1
MGLLRSVWPDTNTATVGVLLWILAGAGKVLVGVAPANENLPLHQIGTVNLPLGSVAILLLALATRHTRIGMFGIVAAVFGLLGTAMSIFAPELLGVGGADTMAGYPGDIWLFVVGAAALLPRRESDRGARGGVVAGARCAHAARHARERGHRDLLGAVISLYAA